MVGAQFLSLFAACVCLALAMNRHYLDVTNALPAPGTKTLLRLAGTSLLAVSCAMAVVDDGWGIGSVQWICLFGLGALTLVLLLNYVPRAVPGLGVGALLATLLSVALR